MKLWHLQKILKRKECVLYIQPVDLHFNFTIKGSCEIITTNCVSNSQQAMQKMFNCVYGVFNV